MLLEKNLNEKRIHPRVPIKIPVKYQLMEDEGAFGTVEKGLVREYNAYTSNLGLEGMCLVVDQTLNAGNIVKFELFLLDKVTSVTVMAEVAWAEYKGVGIHFLLMVNDEREALEDFLKKYSQNPV